MHVLFVCTGNICRSPTAERLAIAFSTESRTLDFAASSAGTRAVVGHPIHPEAAMVLEDLGGDTSRFTARKLTAQIASAADLVLTMTRSHRDAVLELAPHRMRQTFTLSEASRLISEHGARTVADLAARRSLLTSDETLDIADPIGQPSDVFAAVGEQIAHLLPPILGVCHSL